MEWKFPFILIFSFFDGFPNWLSAGVWGWSKDVLRERGTCVTHTSSCQKTGVSLVFISSQPGVSVPTFSGYIVLDYSRYSRLTFLTHTDRQTQHQCT